MKFCPDCGKLLWRSNLFDIFACSVCKKVFSIKKVEFETPPVNQVKTPPIQNQKKEPYKPKDLISIPEPGEEVKKEGEDAQNV